MTGSVYFALWIAACLLAGILIGSIFLSIGWWAVIPFFIVCIPISTLLERAFKEWGYIER